MSLLCDVYGTVLDLIPLWKIFYLYAPDAWSLETVKTRYYPLIMHLGFVMGWLLSLSLFDETSKFKRTFL